MFSRRNHLPPTEVSTGYDSYFVRTQTMTDFTARRCTSRYSSDTKLGMDACSLNLPLISKHGSSNAVIHDKRRNNPAYLRRTASSFVKHYKIGSQRPQQSRHTSHKKPHYSFHLYDLHTNPNFTSFSRFGKQNTWPHASRVAALGCESSSAQALSNMSASPPEERLKAWLRQSYKARQLYAGTADNSSNYVLMTSRESSLVARESYNDPQLPVERASRRSSLTKQRKRMSSCWELPDNDETTEHKSERCLQPSNYRGIRTFRWYVTVVKSLVGLLMSMQRVSVSKTHQSAHSEFLYILAGPKTHAAQQGQGAESQSLLFDKSWFSRTRAWSRMPSWAQTVMRLPPDKRTKENVQHLKQLLGTMRGFRENMTDEMRTKLCEVVTYTRCDTGRIVFRQGHIGHHFYFIFSGSVLIQSDSFNDKTGETETLVENVLRAGEGFGEIALLGDGRRTASVICKEPTELCQIDKDTFLETCPALFEEQLQERIDFVRRFDIFHAWDSEDLKRLCFLSQVLDVPHSRVIDKNWSTSKFAYFVMKGRVSMLKEFDATDIEKPGPNNGVRDKGKQKIVQFAVVGTLHAGDSSDLSVLALEPRKDMSHITLVSEGTRLFRVAVRVFLRLSPRTAMEDYLKVYKPCKIPSEDEIRAQHLHNLNWSEFKKNILHAKLLEKAGGVMASIPATLKGSSGWARWPGYAVIKKSDKMTRDIEEVATANRPTIDKSVQEVTEDSSSVAGVNVSIGLKQLGEFPLSFFSKRQN